MSGAGGGGGAWAADVPEGADGPPNRRRTVALLVIGVAVVCLVATALTGLWAHGAYGPREAGQTVEDVAQSRQLRGGLHGVAGGAAIAALVGLAAFAVLARTAADPLAGLLVSLALLVVGGVAVITTAGASRDHLVAKRVAAQGRGSDALREAAGLEPRFLPEAKRDGGPKPNGTAFWVHLAVAPALLGGATWVLSRRSLKA